MGHVKMMAATQPFLSGAISKTVNLPNDCSVEDIAEAYIEAWRLGLKAVAIYRDGSKGTQPLNVSAQTNDDKKAAAKDPTPPPQPPPDRNRRSHRRREDLTAQPSPKPPQPKPPAPHRSLTEPATAIADTPRRRSNPAQHAPRQRHPERRRASTPGAHRAPSATASPPSAPPSPTIRHRRPRRLHHRRPLPQRRPGEIFIRMAKEGSTISGLMDSFATAISLALQHGVPLKLLCEKFAHTRFEPSGWTGNEQIGYAKSIMDYLFRWIQLRFLSGHQLDLFAGLTPTATGTLTAPSATAQRLVISATEPRLSPRTRSVTASQPATSAPAAVHSRLHAGSRRPRRTPALTRRRAPTSSNSTDNADRTPPQAGIAPDLTASSGLDPLVSPSHGTICVYSSPPKTAASTTPPTP